MNSKPAKERASSAYVEVNFDGLVGPTHNFAGLSFGNVASTSHGGRVSHPKQAAKQGLQKMKSLFDMGLVQAVLPPHERPFLPFLRQLGLSGRPAEMVTKAAQFEPFLLRQVYSAAAMWTANAATVSPSPDTADGRIHMTPANLVSMFHRAIEPEQTARVLQAIFANPSYFAHHPPLPAHRYLGDEGAANHTRFATHYGQKGVTFFVYGQEMGNPKGLAPQKFPARQTLEACRALARFHGLDPKKTVFAQQNPETIDQGVFHNDVIAVGNRNILLCHQDAFCHQDQVYKQLAAAFAPDEIEIIEVPRKEISVAQAVSSYLFNSQLVTLPNEETILIAPRDAEELPEVKNWLAQLVAGNNSIKKVHFFDLRQSMQNGGGPACLRLRIVLGAEERNASLPHVFFTPALYKNLEAWIDRHYRDSLAPTDLADPQLVEESYRALDELSDVLGLGSIYDFQRFTP